MGREFLREFYPAAHRSPRSAHDDVSRALHGASADRDCSDAVYRSWIHADFGIWIAHPEDNAVGVARRTRDFLQSKWIGAN